MNKPLLLLPIVGLALSLSACLEHFSVTKDGYSGFRMGTDVAGESYELDPTTGKLTYTRLKTNNSKSFRAGANVATAGIAAYSVVQAAAEQTAQVVAREGTAQHAATQATTQAANATTPTLIPEGVTPSYSPALSP